MATESLVKKKAYSEPERWTVIFPAYLNSKKTLQEGRRLPAALAVENPTTQEIYDILHAGGFNPVAERKMYPRDGTRDWAVQGRVRVQMKNDDGTPKHSQFPNKVALYKYVVQMIPKLKCRQPGFIAQTSSSQPSNNAGGKKNKRKK